MSVSDGYSSFNGTICVLVDNRPNVRDQICPIPLATDRNSKSIEQNTCTKPMKKRRLNEYPGRPTFIINNFMYVFYEWSSHVNLQPDHMLF